MGLYGPDSEEEEGVIRIPMPEHRQCHKGCYRKLVVGSQLSKVINKDLALKLVSRIDESLRGNH